jgi:hypothetical protein
MDQVRSEQRSSRQSAMPLDPDGIGGGGGFATRQWREKAAVADSIPRVQEVQDSRQSRNSEASNSRI